MSELSKKDAEAVKRHEAVVVDFEKLCDFCKPVKMKRATVDGKTIFGPWANMCQTHYSLHGVGLGMGRGQRLIYK
jgi:hypothetical protein